MLIATAGHIDHGKTSLVRALTGVETDRLPEEKERGISIDLGFAWWRPEPSATIGFVDVPGHERYVRNMIAGLSGIDLALLVIAADDGVMPQTREHLQILDLLGIGRGLVALTKCDRVGAARIAAVRGEISELLAPTALAASPIHAVSSVTGDGIPELAAAILAGQRTRQIDADHGLRLAIDRVFARTGAGTVVTGTVVAGRIAAGDVLSLAPHGQAVRVRGLQRAGEDIAEAGKGERCAVNLAGVEVSAVHRGDWLVTPGASAIATRLDVMFTLSPDREKALKHGSRVHFHHGAADIGARVIVPGQRAIAPGDGAEIRLILDGSTSAICDEPFVLRDSAGRTLLGGGRILDPLPPEGRQSFAQRQTRMEAMAQSSPGERLVRLASAAGIEPDLRQFAQGCNLSRHAMARLVAEHDLHLCGKAQSIAIARARFDGICEAIVEALASHHREHPDSGGLNRRNLRKALEGPLSADLLDSLVDHLRGEGRIEIAGPALRIPGHSASFSPAETAIWQKVLASIGEGSPRPVSLGELARELRLGEAALSAALARRKAAGDLWQVTANRFMLRAHVAELAGLAAMLDEAGFTAARFRDASGLGRNFVIELLEFFDRIGVTRRLGEARQMRGDWQAVVGAPQ